MIIWMKIKRKFKIVLPLFCFLLSSFTAFAVDDDDIVMAELSKSSGISAYSTGGYTNTVYLSYSEYKCYSYYDFDYSYNSGALYGGYADLLSNGDYQFTFDNAPSSAGAFQKAVTGNHSIYNYYFSGMPAGATNGQLALNFVVPVVSGSSDDISYSTYEAYVILNGEKYLGTAMILGSSLQVIVRANLNCYTAGSLIVYLAVDTGLDGSGNLNSVFLGSPITMYQTSYTYRSGGNSDAGNTAEYNSDLNSFNNQMASGEATESTLTDTAYLNIDSFEYEPLSSDGMTSALTFYTAVVGAGYSSLADFQILWKISLTIIVIMVLLRIRGRGS